jgi:hypothetical protein
MSHYAKVLDSKVIQVIVAEPEFFNTFVDTSAGTWIQTSYNTHGNKHPNNTPLRGNFAGLGYTYDYENDVFYASQPFPSWTLNQSTWLWEAPTPCPSDNKFYRWDESTKTWAVKE